MDQEGRMDRVVSALAVEEFTRIYGGLKGDLGEDRWDIWERLFLAGAAWGYTRGVEQRIGQQRTEGEA